MDCKEFQNELPDLVLTAGAIPSVAAVAHLKVCAPCMEEYVSFQETFRTLDAWRAPEPTPYFDQKLAVRLREEQAAPRMSWLERLTTSLQLNTGRNFRPMVAGALALALVIGGGSVVGVNSFQTAPVPQASATVQDLQILDRNDQAMQQLDQLQQANDDGGAPAPNSSGPADGPTS